MSSSTNSKDAAGASGSDSTARTNVSYGTPMWIEIPAVDVQRTKAFYQAAFDWRFPSFPGEEESDMAMFEMSDERMSKLGTGGAIVRVDKDKHVKGQGAMHVYMMVDTIEKAADRIEKAGGKMLGEKTHVPGGSGWVAHFEDIAGNVNGLYANGDEDEGK